MTSNNNGLGGLTAEEQAYFDSRGENVPGAAAKLEPEADAKPASDIPDDDAALDAAPAAKDEPAKPEKTADDDRKVPLKALQEERKARQELAARIKEQEERWKIAEERLQILTQRAAPVAQEEPQGIPDPDEDVFGAAKALIKEIDGLKQAQRQTEARTQQEAATQALVSRYQADAKALKSEIADFDTAYQHLQQSRMQELQRLGLQPSEAQQAIVQDELNLVQMAYRRGENPAQVVYDMAKFRGYRAEAPKAEAKSAPDLGKIEEGMRQNKSLSDGGASPTGPMTIERLIGMSADEFDAYSAKNPKTVQRLMGG